MTWEADKLALVLCFLWGRLQDNIEFRQVYQDAVKYVQMKGEINNVVS